MIAAVSPYIHCCHLPKAIGLLGYNDARDSRSSHLGKIRESRVTTQQSSAVTWPRPLKNNLSYWQSKRQGWLNTTRGQGTQYNLVLWPCMRLVVMLDLCLRYTISVWECVCVHWLRPSIYWRPITKWLLASLGVCAPLIIIFIAQYQPNRRDGNWLIIDHTVLRPLKEDLDTCCSLSAIYSLVIGDAPVSQRGIALVEMEWPLASPLLILAL